jgi:CRP-like cAMP-binding protein
MYVESENAIPALPSADIEQAESEQPRTAQVVSRRGARRPPARRSVVSGAEATLEGDERSLIAAVTRIESLLMILVRRAVQPALEEELRDTTARAIYDATGEKTAREIAQATGVGVATVSRTWARWEALGLVVKEGTRYRRPF